MQTQSQNRKPETRNYGINYTWADSKGRMHIGRTVASGRDRARAERRFFRQHRHISQVDGYVNPQTLMLSALAAIVVVLVLVLGNAMSENRRLRENIRVEEALMETTVRDYANKPAPSSTLNPQPSDLLTNGGGL